MSFAIWETKPPFEFAPEDREQMYQVGDKWVVTDDPAKATQEGIDAALGLPNSAVIGQITTVEAAQPVTQRALREMILAIGVAFPAAQASTFFKKAAEQEQVVAALRAQLR